MTALVQKFANSMSLLWECEVNFSVVATFILPKENGRGEMSSPPKSKFTKWSTVIKFCHFKLGSETHPFLIQKSG